jgi:hypothetical protein
MKRRAIELANRRAALLERSAAQRAVMVAEVDSIAARLEHIDSRIDSVRRFFRRPWLLLGAASALVVLMGPRRLIRAGTRGAMWFGTAQRVLRLVQRLPQQLHMLH